MDMCHLYLVEPILNVSFGGQWMQDPDEYEDGAFVFLNDLLPLFVWTDPYAGWLQNGSLTLEIVSGSSKIKVWESPDKTTELTLPKTWAMEDVPGQTYYIEGVALSDSLRDVELKLTYACGSETSMDKVRLTVLKVEFKARDGKINYGFDPIEALWTGGPYPWASVDKDGSSDVPKIVIEPSQAATHIELNVASGGDYADINPKTFTAGSTDLTIQGEGQAGDALVEAQLVGTTMVCETLNIIARPKRTVNVGIYRIQDPTSPGTEFPPGVPTDNQIISTLNDVFKQAVIGFELEESSGLHEIEYDTVKMPFVDGAFTPGQDGKWQKPEEDAFAKKEPCPWTGDIWVFLVKENGDTINYRYDDPYGDITVRGLPRADPDYVIVFTDGTAGHTELAVAHEIGHLLGLPVKEDETGHDPGPWPQGTERLMRSGAPTGPPESPTLPEPGRWLRHEDWNRANSRAGIYYEE